MKFFKYWHRHPRRSFVWLGLLGLALASWKYGAGTVRPGNKVADGSTPIDINIDYHTDLGTVNPNLMGFNLEYDTEADTLWQNGNGPTAQKLSLIKTGDLRWPGGTLCTFYHWTRFDGIQGHQDSWSPDYNGGKDIKPAGYMNIDEYLAVAKKLKLDLLIGINMGSGKRFNKQQEGIAEAVALVKKVKAFAAANMPNAKKFYFLDNEPYQHDANYPYKSGEEYGREINAYVPALKAIDPSIKIIANSKNEVKEPVWTPQLIRIAGANIDYIDIHYYWRWGALSFDLWKNEPVMMNQQGRPYSQERAALKAIAAANGHPNIDLVAFEWNLGRKIAPGAPEPSESEVALMVAEQFTEFIDSGMPMACFWPLEYPNNPFWNRAVLDATQGYSTNKVYDLFRLYNPVMGGTKMACTVKAPTADEHDRIRTLTVKSGADGKVYIYLINKIQTSAAANITLTIPGFKYKNATVESFDVTDTGHGHLAVRPTKSNIDQTGRLAFSMIRNSLTRITLGR